MIVVDDECTYCREDGATHLPGDKVYYIGSLYICLCDTHLEQLRQELYEEQKLVNTRRDHAQQPRT